MSSKGLLKRLLPFFATFAVGLFIASFFVDISGPRFGRGRWMRHMECERRMEMELQQQREENRLLRDQLESFDQVPHRVDRMKMIDLDTGAEKEIPVPYDAPMPPPRPAAPHSRR